MSTRVLPGKRSECSQPPPPPLLFPGDPLSLLTTSPTLSRKPCGKLLAPEQHPGAVTGVLLGAWRG